MVWEILIVNLLALSPHISWAKYAKKTHNFQKIFLLTPIWGERWLHGYDVHETRNQNFEIHGSWVGVQALELANLAVK